MRNPIKYFYQEWLYPIKYYRSYHFDELYHYDPTCGYIKKGTKDYERYLERVEKWKEKDKKDCEQFYKKEAIKRNWHIKQRPIEEDITDYALYSCKPKGEIKDYITTPSIFADKLRRIRFIFKEWENDINRTGEKLYR